MNEGRSGAVIGLLWYGGVRDGQPIQHRSWRNNSSVHYRGPVEVTMRLSFARLAPPPVSRGMASGKKT